MPKGKNRKAREQDGGGRKGGKGGKGGKPGPKPPSPLQEAQTLQQKASRMCGRGRWDPTAGTLYEQALGAFQHALQEGCDAAEGLIGAAECYHRMAELMAEALKVESACPNATTAAKISAKIVEHAKAATDLYARVKREFPAERTDAAVNLGGVLSLCADHSAIPECSSLYSAALAEYDEALGSTDVSKADILENKADMLQSMAERADSAGDAGEAVRLFGAANQAYNAACMETDSRMGDDLVGILEGWAGNWLSLASATQGTPPVTTCIENAIMQFNGAYECDKSSTTALCGIGDALMVLAEGEASPVRVKEALDRGYHPALAINDGDADANVGIAEAQFLLGKLTGNAEHFASSAQRYLAVASHHWADFGSCSDRSDFLFNSAIACSLAGLKSEAVACLRQCVSYGLTSKEEVLAEPDLADDVKQHVMA